MKFSKILKYSEVITMLFLTLLLEEDVNVTVTLRNASDHHLLMEKIVSYADVSTILKELTAMSVCHFTTIARGVLVHQLRRTSALPVIALSSPTDVISTNSSLRKLDTEDTVLIVKETHREFTVNSVLQTIGEDLGRTTVLPADVTRLDPFPHNVIMKENVNVNQVLLDGSVTSVWMDSMISVQTVAKTVVVKHLDL